MVLGKIPALAVSSMLCVQLALSETLPLDSLMPDTSVTNKRIADHVDMRLERIADRINFVHLEERVNPAPIFDFVPATVAGRLAYLQKTVPLTYNEQVQYYIGVYSTDRYRGHLSRMMGLARYYFPIYERVFAETGVPEEIKYLSIVESALNPHAVSRVGATGLWQFMFATARMYDLAMDSYIDERKDPVAASYAAAAYLTDAYDEFGDWLLAIASYNCGKGNVLRAIQRSGLSNPDYWSISRYLPRETRNYVPAFIAITYMLGYHKEHGIRPDKPDLLMDTEIVWVQKFVPLSGVARALEVEEDLIESLNPAYKRGVVNGTPEFPRRLVLPEAPPKSYPALYAVLNAPHDLQTVNVTNGTRGHTHQTTLNHRVRKGETLGKIANRYHVSVQDLKVWNGLKKNVIVPGQNLRVVDSGSNVTSHNEPQADSDSYITYHVKKGDTLSGIAQRHRKATVSTIKSDNGLESNRITPGMRLKIKVD